jgi:hypothetical protein
MLDIRAWIIGCILILLIAGGFVLWMTRPHAGYTARSLTAAPPSANPTPQTGTKPLHVDGCDRDFIVKAGELVEPLVTPGSTIEQFRGEYGKEKKVDAGVAAWDEKAFELTEGQFPSSTSAAKDTGIQPQNYEHLSLKQGHVVETLDAIELGVDSFATIFRDLRDRKIESHERLVVANGNVTYTVSFYSACGRRFRSEYSRTIPDSPEVERLIAPHTPANSSQQNATNAHSLPRSDIFMNKIVYEYTMVPWNGRDDSSNGSLSEHD